MTTYTITAHVREEALDAAQQGSIETAHVATLTLVNPSDAPVDFSVTSTPDANGVFSDEWTNIFAGATLEYAGVTDASLEAFEASALTFIGATSSDTLTDRLVAQLEWSFRNVPNELVLAKMAFAINDPAWNQTPVDLDDDSIFTGVFLNESAIGLAPTLDLLGDLVVTEDDTIVGTDASDWINAGLGNDSVDLGDGIDTFSLVALAEGATASLEAGSATIGDLTKTLTSVENLTGTSFADFITGDAGNNTLRGLGGTDWFTATDGSDQYQGGAGNDTVSYVQASTGVTVDLTRAQLDANGLFVDQYSSVENITGTSFADVIFGNASDNVLRGLGGNDVFFGTAGDDRYDGGAGVDTVSYANATEGVFAWLQTPTAGASDAHGDTFGSIERLIGSDFDDILRGTNVTETREWLEGGAGNDRLIGDAGIDYLTGGTGDDTLEGGTGFDYVLYDGNQDEFSFVTNSNGKTIVTHLDGVWGVDTLENIQVMRFDDGDVMLGAGF